MKVWAWESRQRRMNDAGVEFYLRADLRTTLRIVAGLSEEGEPADQCRAVLAVLRRLPGEIYRRTASRRTMRWEAGGRAYFVKLHDGVGWREIVKNLGVLKVPVVSARNEYLACKRLAEAGVRAPEVAGFGTLGGNPATRKSFVVCDALDDFISLEELAALWRQRPPPLWRKRELLSEVARLARRLHGAGVNHRDFYLGHLYVKRSSAMRPSDADAHPLELAVIDLHRAGLWPSQRCHRRVPNRWLARDLAALFFSATDADPNLTQRDLLRFVRDYVGERPAAAIRAQPRLWRTVLRRARRLAAEGRRDTAALTP